MAWLPNFVERHRTLKFIKFSGGGSSWRQNPDILFPLQFIDAVERESLTLAVDLESFSIFRAISASSLDDWQVLELEMTINDELGLSALRIASLLAPQISSLVIRMSRFTREPVHTVSSATFASASC
jgi:hypothetical protein